MQTQPRQYPLPIRKCFPDGLFRYQHATGDDIDASLAAGFNNWVEFDLPAFLDAISNSLETCTAPWIWSFPEPARRIRRCPVGPVYHLASNNIEIEEEHPFCHILPAYKLVRSF